MRVSRRISIVAALVVVTVLAGLAALVGSSSSQASPQAAKATFLASLVSDIGKFNDRSFNQSQKEGLMRAQKKLRVKVKPLQSNSTSDYIPNLTSAVRRALRTSSSRPASCSPTRRTRWRRSSRRSTSRSPTTRSRTRRSRQQGNVLKNVDGPDLRGERVRLPGRRARRQDGAKAGHKVIGAVGGLKIPPVDIWIAGLQVLRAEGGAGHEGLIDYSQDFVAADKCKTVAENMIAQQAQVLFQVAGGCGLGTLKAAAAAHIWGIGVDKDQYKGYLGKHILTSATRPVDVSVYEALMAS